MDKVSGDPNLAAYAEGIFSSMRHQLGNAVNALKVTLDVLQENFEDFDDAKRKEYVKRAKELLDRQQTLIDAMRAYSIVSARDLKRMAFRPFWRHFVEEASRRMERQNIKLTHHADASPCEIMGTPISLDTALGHLLDNAVEALDEVNQPEIELDASVQDGRLMITVRDNGSGIREKDLPRVFLPLYTTKPGKRGMGLTIALKLLSGMGGHLELEALREGGTRARVWLKTLGGEENEKTIQV